MKKKREEEKKNDDNKEHIDKGKEEEEEEEEEEETKTMTTKINKEEKEDEGEEKLNTNLTRLKISFLQLTSGAHITVCKYGCSWNDRRQPVFTVTSLFTRFNFVARLSRYLRY